MAKQIISNADESAKKSFITGIDKTANMVGSTMGAAGKTVVISNHFLSPPYITKDGVTVVRAVMLDNHLENVGAQMLKSAAEKTADLAGDGTTQTVVLAQAMIKEALKQVASGANPQRLKEGIEHGVNLVVSSLKDSAVTVGDSNSKIKNVATISANNDVVIGGLIADAYEKIGNDGLLMIEDSGTIDTVIEVVEGVEIQKGYISPHFANNKDKMQAVYDNPLFLVTDYHIKSMSELAPIFQQINDAKLMQQGIVIFAQDYEGEVFSSMVQNVVKGNVRCTLCKAPSAYRKETLEDIAILTGGVMISDEAGIKMEGIKLKHLGRAKKVVVSQDSTLIVGGDGAESSVKLHKKSVKVQMEEMKDEALKDVWRKRLARISGNIGVIKVGAATDVELNEKKDRVDDACRAVKSAIEEGIIVGGGIALLRIKKRLLSTDHTGDFRTGVEIVAKACDAPLIKMLENAGLEKSTIFGEIDKQDGNNGYNIKSMKQEDLFEAGVVDPVKVIRCAIQNASSVTGAILTSDYFLIEMPAK